MFRLASRAARAPLVLTIAALAACADDPPATAPGAPPEPNLAVGDVITVTNASGATDAGSLRWAVAQATGGEVIRFAPGLAGATITLDTTLVIAHGVTIEGPQDKGITLSVSGNARVIYVENTTPTTLRNLTITGGKVPGEAGGGIFASGELALEHTTVRGNEAAAGGAIWGNVLRLTNSTVSGNTSYEGFAAVTSASGPLTVVNSTVAYNVNGGIEPGSVGMVLRNSIIAKNGSGQNCVGFASPTTYAGQNLSDDTSCGTGPGMLVVSDAMLAPLADNGGPTMTHAFAPSSPALDAGKDCTVSVDQRHAPRDARCDIGAFELSGFATITLTINPSIAVNPSNGWAIVTGTMQCSRAERFDLAVSLKQNQRSVRAATVVQAGGNLSVDCDATLRPWSIVLVPSSGGFVNGGAEAAAQTANTGRWVTPSAVTNPVKLYWAHK